MSEFGLTYTVEIRDDYEFGIVPGARGAVSVATLISEPFARPRRSARPSGRGSSHRLLAAIVILASTTFSLLYVWLHCPLDLAPDEAHYWDWSRHLDWSYYSKGPLVAWLIRFSCEVVGPLCLELTGNLSAAVRLPASSATRRP